MVKATALTTPIQCPFYGGRAKNAKLNPKTAALSNKVAPVDAPAFMTTCCGGFAKVPCEGLDHYQRIPYGTTANAKSLGRRSVIESINNNVKTNEGLTRDFLGAFGLAAHRFAMAIMVFAHNFELMIHDPQPASEEEHAATQVVVTEHEVVDAEMPECDGVPGDVDEIGHPPPPD